MEVMEIIDMMEEAIDKAPSVPLSGKILLAKEDILDYIQEIRLVFPEEVKEAKWVKGERERILAEAEARSDEMIKNAENKVAQMIDEHEVTKQAVEQATQMVNNAQQETMKIIADCDQYVDAAYQDLEKGLDMLAKKVHDDRMRHESEK